MGIFVTVEGVEGSGKTTLIAPLAEYYRQRGCEVFTSKEPGGTAVGARIREIVLHRDEYAQGITPMAELLLFAADRAEHCQTVLEPALKSHKLVICDRFTSSTLAYQGYGAGLPLETLHYLNNLATQGLKPQLTLILDMSPEKALRRAKVRAQHAERVNTRTTRNDDWNHFEKQDLSFHERVRNGFLEIARASGDSERQTVFVVIDAERSAGDVLNGAIAAIDAILVD